MSRSENNIKMDVGEVDVICELIKRIDDCLHNICFAAYYMF
jgi:hypothetical protein